MPRVPRRAPRTRGGSASRRRGPGCQNQKNTEHQKKTKTGRPRKEQATGRERGTRGNARAGSPEPVRERNVQPVHAPVQSVAADADPALGHLAHVPARGLHAVDQGLFLRAPAPARAPAPPALPSRRPPATALVAQRGEVLGAQRGAVGQGDRGAQAHGAVPHVAGPWMAQQQVPRRRADAASRTLVGEHVADSARRGPRARASAGRSRSMPARR